MNLNRSLLLLFVLALASLSVYYFYPFQRIPPEITIDKILVLKSKRQILAYSDNRLIITYKIAIGKTPVGKKEFEHDFKTPEGFYIVNDKNPNSAYHKNLGISYPNEQDRSYAHQMHQPAGGDIKIHGLRNDQAFFGRFQRWRDWTNGCIALTNEELDDLYAHTPVGTSIEIRP